MTGEIVALDVETMGLSPNMGHRIIDDKGRSLFGTWFTA